MAFRYSPWILLVLSAAVLRDNCSDAAMSMQQMENAASGFRKSCIQKVGVDPALVAGTKNGEFPADEKLQCYMKCVMGVLKTLKNGRPVLDAIMKQITVLMPTDMQAQNIAAAQSCSTLDFDDNDCIAAWQYVKCQYETAPEAFFFP